MKTRDRMRKTLLLGVMAVMLSLLVSTALAGSPGPLKTQGVPSKPSKETGFVKLPSDANVRVIVTLKESATDAKIKDMMVTVGSFKVEAKGWNQVYPTGFAATMKKSQMLALLNNPAVERVDIDQKVYAQLETATYWSGVTKARAAPTIGYNVSGNRDGKPYNYSTTDVVIAIIDTGIDRSHIDLTGLNNNGTQKIIGWYDVVNGYTAPYDDNGHGTHVASIAAGEGDDNPRYKGVAPGAALVGVKVLTGDGWGYWSWVITGVNWAVTNKNNTGIRIMSLSLGGMGTSDGTDPVSVALNNAVNQGIVVTVAAGNAGPQKYTISIPGAAANVITVCAMADPGYLLRALPGISEVTQPAEQRKVIPAGQVALSDNGFYLAPFSSRGPTADNRQKPDICAPGVMINAAKATLSSGSYTPPYHGGYIEYSGTSMATPFVAGVAALMLDAKYSLTPAQIKSGLLSSAEDWGLTGADYDYGYGRIRAYKAVGWAATGSMPTADQVVPIHTRYSTSINDATWYVTYPVTITNDNNPFATTMIMYDFSGFNPGFFMSPIIQDPSGNYYYPDTFDRQQTIVFNPDRGTYYIWLEKYAGAGRYALDISRG